MQGRDEPATFPRVKLIRIVCSKLPWMITVQSSNPSVGVTCGELIEHISDNMYKHVSKQEMKFAPNQRSITETYWYNRSTAPDVPGGRLGDGVRRVDWLLRHTAFGGIERNDRVAKEQCGGEVLPCTFELKCEQKFEPHPMDEEEEENHRQENQRRENQRQENHRQENQHQENQHQENQRLGTGPRSISRSRSRGSVRVNVIE